jgi:hypothetical protein
MPKLPDMSKTAIEKRAQMQRPSLPVPQDEKPKVRIAQSRIGSPTRKKKPAKG